MIAKISGILPFTKQKSYLWTPNLSTMANQDITPEQANKQRLIELLESVDRPGNYCVGGSLPVFMPQIILENVGTLSFPVPQVQIDALVEMAEQAPYGKGTKTLTDTSVRDCWQIDASQIRVTGKAWADSFKEITNLVSEGLGLNQGQLGAKLYKLLVYKEGGFFAAHRDTEKVPGMVATLSLSLPTPGEGGELSIRHGDQETVFNMNAEEPSELSYAAFYADCLHEARPVTKGHRISLIYNLFVQSGEQWSSAPDYSELVGKVKECLADWVDSGTTEKIVWVLDHSYSEEGLSFGTLKGTDAAVAQVLAEAAGQVDCDMHAAILHIQETGDPEIDYDGSYWGDTTVGSTIEELHDRTEHLENWVAHDDSRPPFGNISVREGELIPIDSTDDLDPDEERIEGYMGNAGPTLELIYRLGSLVVWPKSNTLNIVARGGLRHAVSWVATQCDKASGTEMQRMLSKLTNMWPESRSFYNDHNRPVMLQILGTTGSADLAADFLNQTVLIHYDGSENEQLAKLMPVVGPESAEEFLPKLIEQHLIKYPKEVLSLLARITETLGQAEPAWHKMMQGPAKFALSSLRPLLENVTEIVTRVHYDDVRGNNECGISKAYNDNPLDSTIIRSIFSLTWHLNLTQESVETATTIANFPKAATPDRMVPEALVDLSKIERVRSTEAYRLLWRQSVDFLLQRSSAPPEAPVNWIIDADIPCTCELCTDLQEFCLNPDRRTKSFKVAKASRRIIHKTIQVLGLNMDHVTERKGSPYTLHCTKNRDGHKQRLIEYSEDVKHIERLLTLTPENATGNAEVRRIKRLEAAKRTFQNSR